jgi:NhaA family Na+:H+ antiporter
MNAEVLFANQVAMGVLCGLLLGKPIGIAVAVWVTEKLALAGGRAP